jgi:hypothetical protein
MGIELAVTSIERAEDHYLVYMTHQESGSKTVWSKPAGDVETDSLCSSFMALQSDNKRMLDMLKECRDSLCVRHSGYIQNEVIPKIDALINDIERGEG